MLLVPVMKSMNGRHWVLDLLEDHPLAPEGVELFHLIHGEVDRNGYLKPMRVWRPSLNSFAGDFILQEAPDLHHGPARDEVTQVEPAYWLRHAGRAVRWGFCVRHRVVVIWPDYWHGGQLAEFPV